MFLHVETAKDFISVWKRNVKPYMNDAGQYIPITNRSQITSAALPAAIVPDNFVHTNNLLSNTTQPPTTLTNTSTKKRSITQENRSIKAVRKQRKMYKCLILLKKFKSIFLVQRWFLVHF
jgi:hypothetical protein